MFDSVEDAPYRITNPSFVRSPTENGRPAPSATITRWPIATFAVAGIDRHERLVGGRFDGGPRGDEVGAVSDDHRHRGRTVLALQLDHLDGSTGEFDHPDRVGLGRSGLDDDDEPQQEQASRDQREEQETPAGASDVGTLLDPQCVGGESELGRMAPDAFVLRLWRRR